uniref:Sm domain-containing protein n=1 Tax=Graphocephala atropunctata TaxID=36148 RepID=A0A1B6LCE3_9HEMI
MSEDMDEDVFIQYRHNIFNMYLGCRIRITLRNRKKRTTVFIGTFKGYDYHVNVVLSDVYRVILNHTEEQRQDVAGLLVVRGSTLRSVSYADPEPHLRPWPTKPISTRTSRRRAKEPVKEPPTPSTPSKPVKLKRTWQTTASPAVEPSREISSEEGGTTGTPTIERDEGLRGEGKGTTGDAITESLKSEGGKSPKERVQRLPETLSNVIMDEIVFNEDTPKSEDVLSPKGRVGKLSDILSNVVIKEEIEIKDEPENDSSTFEEFLLTNVGEDYFVKSEATGSHESDMSP